MEKQHVVGEVRKALTPEEVVKVLMKFRGQRNEIEKQLIAGGITSDEVQALIEHRPIIKKGNGPIFHFRDRGLFPGAEALYFDPENYQERLKNCQKKLKISEEFIKAFYGYKQDASEKAPMAVCEFVGNPTDKYILSVLGSRIRIGISELLWAIDSLAEANWWYACYITGSDKRDRAVSFAKSGEKTFIECRVASNTQWWASNIRVIGFNRFCP